jgi:HlyD family secretion protein
MEIEAYIDESDIGQIRTEQNVRFTVDAFPDRQFNGRVNQIRKAPQSNAGVISYIVIIDTRNPDSSLLPGMTANLDISIDTLRDAQRVSNAALRAATRFGVTTDGETRGMAALEQLDLSAEQREIIRERLPRREAGAPASRNRQQRQQLQALLREVLTEEQLQLQENIRNGQVKLGQLLIMDDEGVQPVQVQFGISDDKFTAVLSPDLGDAEVVTQFKVNN